MDCLTGLSRWLAEKSPDLDGDDGCTRSSTKNTRFNQSNEGLARPGRFDGVRVGYLESMYVVRRVGSYDILKKQRKKKTFDKRRERDTKTIQNMSNK